MTAKISNTMRYDLSARQSVSVCRATPRAGFVRAAAELSCAACRNPAALCKRQLILARRRLAKLRAAQRCAMRSTSQLPIKICVLTARCVACQTCAAARWAAHQSVWRAMPRALQSGDARRARRPDHRRAKGCRYAVASVFVAVRVRLELAVLRVLLANWLGSPCGDGSDDGCKLAATCDGQSALCPSRDNVKRTAHLATTATSARTTTRAV